MGWFSMIWCLVILPPPMSLLHIPHHYELVLFACVLQLRRDGLLVYTEALSFGVVTKKIDQ